MTHDEEIWFVLLFLFVIEDESYLGNNWVVAAKEFSGNFLNCALQE